ncbi:MAG: acyl-CoA dehydratase activase [Thermoplasmata archaeon]
MHGAGLRRGADAGGGGVAVITAGVDVGSTYTKVSILADGKVVGYAVVPTGADAEAAAAECLKRALEMARLKRPDVQYIVSTGYGRKLVQLTIANESVSEIMANAAGTRFIAADKGIRTILDIGGQDTKIISLDAKGNMVKFQMNDRCAAGTGRFLEVMARVLEIPLDQLGPESLKSKNPVTISSTCTVFAKSEVASMLARRVPKEDIAAGIHKSMAERMAIMARKVGVVERVFFDGGPARNIGMRKAMEDELKVKLVVPEMPQIVTSIGAARIAAERAAAKGAG